MAISAAARATISNSATMEVRQQLMPPPLPLLPILSCVLGRRQRAMVRV